MYNQFGTGQSAAESLQWDLIRVYSKQMAGWDKEYNLESVKLNFLVVMGVARICPEEEGTKSQRQKLFCLGSPRQVVLIAGSLTPMWEAEARCVMPGC